MYESMHKYFNIGLIHFMAYPGSAGSDGYIEETIRKILADDYFDAIEITHIEDDTVRARVKDLIAQSHIKPCFGAQPILLSGKLNPNSIDEEQRIEAQQTLISAIDEAHFMGADGIAFLSGKWSVATKEASYFQLVKTTSVLCEYAAEKGMNIELEVFDYDVDKASLIGPAQLAAEFAQDIRSSFSNFGLLADLSHLPLTHESAQFAIKTMSAYITHLHIGNAVIIEGATGHGDLHPRFGFPNGENDVPEVLDFLRVCQDEGLFREQAPLTLSFEVKPWQVEDSDIVVANAKRVLNRAWALL